MILGGRCLFTLHNTKLPVPPYVFKYIVRNALAVVSLNNRAAQVLLRLGLRSTVINNCVRVSGIKKRSGKGSGRKIIMVGSLFEQKNQINAIRAVRLLLNQHPEFDNCSIDIFGEVLRTALQNEIDSLGLTQKSGY